MKNTLTILILVLVVGAVALAFVGLQQSERERAQNPQTATPPQTQKAELPKTLYNLGGTVQSVGTNSFVMEAKIPEIAEDYSLTHRLELKTVTITPQTKITRLSFIVEAGTNQKRPQETEVPFSALRRRDSVEVISNRDVREGEISAIQLRILPSG